MRTGGRIFFACIPATIEDGNLRLRPLRLSDGAFLKSGFSGEGGFLATGLSSPVSAPAGTVRRWINRTYDLAWCIEIDSRPAGFAGIFRLRPAGSAEASLVIFDVTLRGRGYGRRAFSMIAGTLARHAGVRRLAVNVLEENRGALLFWEKMGFRRVSGGDGICGMELCLSPPRH